MEDKCVCCGTVIPEGQRYCPNCLVHAAPPEPKYAPGTWIKYKDQDQCIYNVTVDSYYNDSVGMHLYRLNELMMLPVWREDWLEPVSDEEKQMLIEASTAGKLKRRRHGGCYIEQEEPAHV